MSRAGIGGGSGGGGGGGSVLVLNKLVNVAFDTIAITARNVDGSPTTVEYRTGMTVVATLTITYDVNGDLETVTRS